MHAGGVARMHHGSIPRMSGLPPAPADPRPHAARFGVTRGLVLGAIVAVALALLLAPPLHPAAPVELVRLAGASLCTYAVFVLLAWFPLPWLSRKIEALFEDVVGEGETGWYLAVALAHFALAQSAQVFDDFAAAESMSSLVRETVIQHLIGFSADSFMNALRASLWPFFLMHEHGWKHALALALFVWGVWRVGRWVFGETPLDTLGERAAAADDREHD